MEASLATELDVDDITEDDVGDYESEDSLIDDFAESSSRHRLNIGRGLGPYVLRRLQVALAGGMSGEEALQTTAEFYYFPRSRIEDLGRYALGQLSGLEAESFRPLFHVLGVGVSGGALLEPTSEPIDIQLSTTGASSFNRISRSRVEVELSETANILKISGNNNLNDTEACVLELMVLGFTKPQIAEKLGLTENSVKANFSIIYGKYGLGGLRPIEKPQAMVEVAKEILQNGLQTKDPKD